MGFVRIETPQNVPIEYQTASLGDRLLASLLDWVIRIGYYFIVYMLLMVIFNLTMWGNGLDDISAGIAFVMLVLIVIPTLFYDLILEMLFKGQTIGKMVMGTRVVKLDGSRPGLASYALRWLIGVVEIIMTLGSVAIVAVVANGHGQRLGDLAAGTALVKVQGFRSVNQSIHRHLDQSYQPRFPQVALLTDADMNIVDDAFRKAVRFNNMRLMKHLTSHLIKILQLDPATDERLKGIGPREFLRTVVRDYNYYTGKL